MALQRFSRVGELEKKDLLPPKSRDEGRCCQDKVPVLLRRGEVEVEGGFGDVSISLPSARDPLRLPLVVIDTSSRMKSDFGVDSRSGSYRVGSSCSGGSIARGVVGGGMLSRAASNIGGESFVGDMDLARSALTPPEEARSASEIDTPGQVQVSTES